MVRPDIRSPGVIGADDPGCLCGIIPQRKKNSLRHRAINQIVTENISGARQEVGITNPGSTFCSSFS